MPELLIELFSEEIPARMQQRAGEDLKALVTNGLVEAGLVYEGARARATPRRLALAVEGLAGETPGTREERKGPRTDAPEAAIQGFIKSAGVTLKECRVQEDKKGSVYIATIVKPGRATAGLVAELLRDVVWKFPWPKSMRWGSGTLRWVRPLHSILCCFDGEVVPLEIEGIVSGDITRGHRFLSPKPIKARRFDDYVKKLRAAHVVLDAGERAEIIRAEAKNLSFARGLDLVEDEALLKETAGLVEWPVVLMGAFDESFLAVPPEVIVTSIKQHQKCFALRGRDGKLANRYLLVSNMLAKDGGAQIIAGNDKVIAARLSDAKFFWEQDKKLPLQDRLPALDQITFHAKLGSQGERVQRIVKLSGEIARTIGANAEHAEQAARLAKADLVTGMIGEFPELQGLMGRYYALEQGVPAEVADAIRDHYKPQGPGDTIPATPVGMAVSLADKLDMLGGFWAIDEKPTGSKDPYALRRAALGVIRIVLDGKLRLPLSGAGVVSDDLENFFADRLKVHLREQGRRHDLIDAVYALGGQDDLLMIVRRVEALTRFLGTEDGKSLLAGVKRAANILKIEEKKDARTFDGLPNSQLLIQGEEKALHTAVNQAAAQANKAVEAEDFEAAMAALAKLRAPVDAFFDKVTVNSDDPSFRENRLKLLTRIRAATLTVADFSKIEG